VLSIPAQVLYSAQCPHNNTQ